MENLQHVINALQQQLNQLTTTFELHLGQQNAVIEAQRQDIARHENSLAVHEQAIAPRETEYNDEPKPDGFIPDLSAIKNLPAFNGDRDQYAAWRKQASLTMKMYESHKADGSYFKALTILMNAKITGLALSELTSTNTALNFEAIMKRLDHAFAEKRTIELLRQQLQLMCQGAKKPMEFYDSIEKHLNLIIGKIQIEFDGKPEVIKVLINDHRNEALKTLLRGLQPAVSNKLQMKSPSNLLDAYGKLQEVEFEFEHQKIMSAISMPRKTITHPNLQSNEKSYRPPMANQYAQPFVSYRPQAANHNSQPFVRPPSQQFVPPNTFNAQRQNFVRPPQHYNNYNNNPINDDVSMKVLPEKRPHSGHQSFQHKQQRINNIETIEGDPVDETEQHHDDNNEPEEDTISFLGEMTC